MRASVTVAEKERALRDLPAVIKLAGYNLSKVRRALIKPNICGLYHPEPRLIKRIVEVFKPFADEVIIGETASVVHPFLGAAFRAAGIYEIAKDLDVEARDLLEDEVIRVSVPSHRAVKEFPIPKVVLESDLIVNVPRLGTHPDSKITCSLKNIFGLVAVRNKFLRYHTRGVNKVIADLNKIIRPNLNIVDAGRHIFVGIDPLAVDILAAEYLGVEPERVPLIQMCCEDRGLNLSEVRPNVVNYQP